MTWLIALVKKLRCEYQGGRGNGQTFKQIFSCFEHIRRRRKWDSTKNRPLYYNRKIISSYVEKVITGILFLLLVYWEKLNNLLYIFTKIVIHFVLMQDLRYKTRVACNHRVITAREKRVKYDGINSLTAYRVLRAAFHHWIPSWALSNGFIDES